MASGEPMAVAARGFTHLDGLATRRRWIALTSRLGDRLELVGDDNFCTNPAIITHAIERGIATVADHSPAPFVEAIDGATPATVSSGSACRCCGGLHRRPRPGWPSESGAPARGERVAKYNRLIEIEATEQHGLRYGTR